MKQPPDPHYCHRFPAEIISHAVWLYHVFSLSPGRRAASGRARHHRLIRDGAALVQEFGQSFAQSMRRRRSHPGDKWHMDEVFIRIQGVLHYLWRAERFFKRLLTGLQYVTRVIVTDKLRSYGVARRELLPQVEHRQSRYLTDMFDKRFSRLVLI